jgi:hypothetical protein
MLDSKQILRKGVTDGKFTQQFLSAYRGAFYIKGACGDGTTYCTSMSLSRMVRCHSDTYATKSSDPPISLHRIPPPKETTKVLRESPLVDENTDSIVVRHSPWVTCLHLVVVR